MTRTVIYLSSNQEDPAFEKKIQADILSKCGKIPIISVTQKPMDFGKNICVGEVGASGFNFCRQVLIACKNATTDLVVHAEADCLYSPDYFTSIWFGSKIDACYRNTNIYVQKYKQDFACKKESSTFSSIVGRKYYIKRLEELFVGMPEWSMEYKNFPKEIGKKLFDEFVYFETEYPCISFKTGQGMRKHSSTDEIPVYKLPYWGSVKNLRKQYENI